MPKSDRPVVRPVLHHWGYRTLRRQEMIDWYEKVIGSEIVVQSDSPVPSTYVTNDGQHHRGSFVEFPQMPDADEKRNAVPGVGHLAWTYDSLDDLLSQWARLEEEGISALIMTNHGPTFAFYYKDPDKNTVELMCDAYGDEEQSMAAFLTDEVQQNPMGYRVDPRKLIAAREAGVSPLEVQERTRRGEYEPDEPQADPSALA